MKDLNSIMLTGHLTADPELRYTNNGFAVMKFSLAFNKSRKVGDEWQEFGNFIDCKIFGKQAEFFAERLHKGSFVAVLGELEQERWQTQEGQNRSRIIVRIDGMRFMDAAPKESQNVQSAPYVDASVYDEDIPF